MLNISSREMHIGRWHEETSKEMAPHNSAGKVQCWRVSEPGHVDGNIRRQDEGRSTYRAFLVRAMWRPQSYGEEQVGLVPNALCQEPHMALCISRTARSWQSMKSSENWCSNIPRRNEACHAIYCSRMGPSSGRLKGVKNEWQVKEKDGKYRCLSKWLSVYSERFVW